MPIGVLNYAVIFFEQVLTSASYGEQHEIRRRNLKHDERSSCESRNLVLHDGVR